MKEPLWHDRTRPTIPAAQTTDPKLAGWGQWLKSPCPGKDCNLPLSPIDTTKSCLQFQGKARMRNSNAHMSWCSHVTPGCKASSHLSMEVSGSSCWLFLLVHHVEQAVCASPYPLESSGSCSQARDHHIAFSVQIPSHQGLLNSRTRFVFPEALKGPAHVQKPLHAMPVLELIYSFLQDFAQDALLRHAAVLGCNHASEGLQRVPCRRPSS